MPIYEYACPNCGRVSGFLIRNTGAHRPPKCPHCGTGGLRRTISRFAPVGARRPTAAGRSDGEAGVLADGSEGRIPAAGDDPSDPDLAGMESLLDGVDENDPRSMGRAMRKLSEHSGEPLGEEMDEVVRRLESGEDPEKIEEKLGGAAGGEDGGGSELYDG